MSYFPVVGIVPFWMVRRNGDGLMVRDEKVLFLYFNPEYVSQVYRDRAVLALDSQKMLEDLSERKGVSKGMGKLES